MRIPFLFIVFLLALSTTVSAQIQSIQQLKKDGKTDLNMYFYPSTLRMVNIEQDTAINKLIKGVRKASFHQIHPDSIDATSFFQLKGRIMQEENFKDYLTMESGRIGSGQGFQIIGNEKGNEWVAMAFLEGQGFLIYVSGTINWLQAPKVYRYILEQSEKTDSGFGILLNYLKENKDQRKRRKEWEQKRQKERKDKKESIEATIEFN